MVRQKQICVKLDKAIFRALEDEAYVKGISRNRIINDAVRMYCELSDARRTSKALPSTVYPHPAVRSFLDYWLPHLKESPTEKSIYFP